MKKQEEKKITFDQVYKEYKEYVSITVKSFLYKKKDWEDDICQNVWLLVHRRLEQYDPERGVFTQWLYTITKHEIFKFLGKKQHQKEFVSLDHKDFNFDYHYNIFDYSEAFKEEKEKKEKEKIELIRIKSFKLPRSSREIFQLYHFDGLKHDEIAEIKGLSPNTSKSQLIRARKKIKQLF